MAILRWAVELGVNHLDTSHYWTSTAAVYLAAYAALRLVQGQRPHDLVLSGCLLQARMAGPRLRRRLASFVT
jgi:hypothetical protein